MIFSTLSQTQSSFFGKLKPRSIKMETWQIVFICVIAMLGFLCLCCLCILGFYAMKFFVYLLICCCVRFCPKSDGSEGTEEEDIKNVEDAGKLDRNTIEPKPLYTPSPTPDITVPISPIRQGPHSVA